MNATKLILFFLLLSLTLSTSFLKGFTPNKFQATVQGIELTDEVDYTFDYQASKTYGIDYAPFLFGTHDASTSKGVPVNLHVDTSLGYIALADAKPATGTGLAWGINCSDAGSNCTLDDPSAAAVLCSTLHADFDTYSIFSGLAPSTPVNYWAASNTCRPAHTFMRWTNNTLSVDASKVNQYLPVTLFETAPAVDASAGLLGLAPNGDFFKYVTKYTDWKSAKYVEFGLSLTPNSGASNLVNDTKKDNWKSNQFVVHGKRNGGSIPFYTTVTDLSSWFINQSNVTIGDGSYKDFTVNENQNICVSTQYPKMLAFSDATSSTQMQTYLAKVCEGVTGSCTLKTMDKSKISDLHIGLYNTTAPNDAHSKSYNLTLHKNDFLYFSGANDDTPAHLVGDHIDFTDVASQHYGCPTTTNVVLGRAFLSRYEAVLKVSGETEMGLGFVANEGTSSVFLIILIILGCIILAICIAIILLKVCKRKSDDGDYNRQE